MGSDFEKVFIRAIGTVHTNAQKDRNAVNGIRPTEPFLSYDFPEVIELIGIPRIEGPLFQDVPQHILRFLESRDPRRENGFDICPPAESIGKERFRFRY